MKRSRKEKKKIRFEINERLDLVDDSLEPYVIKELKKIIDKYGLEDLSYKFHFIYRIKIKW